MVVDVSEEIAILKIIKNLMKDSSIIGVLVTNEEAEIIASLLTEARHRKDALNAASAALVALSRMSFSELTQDEAEYILNYTQDTIYATVRGPEKTIITGLINRFRMGSAKIDKYLTNFSQAATKISGIIQASKYPRKSLLGKVKKAFPEVTSIAVISTEGIPIAVDPKSDAIKISAIISAIFSSMRGVSERILSSILVGKNKQSLILHGLDENRLLAILVPQTVDTASYISKIKKVIKD